MLHAAGVTGDYQQLHYCGIADQGDEGYTQAVVLLEAAGLVGQHHVAATESGGDYDVMRFETTNGSITVSAPNGSVERTRRMVMTPAEQLCGYEPDTVIAPTPFGRATLAGIRAYRDGDPHDEAVS